MNSRNRLFLCCCVWIGLLCGSARAQFRLDIETVAFDVYEDETETDSLTNAELARKARLQPVLIRNFEQMMFNQHGTQAGAKKHLQSELRKWLDVTDGALELNADERAKLWLAGCSDIASLFDEVNEFNALLIKGDKKPVNREGFAELQLKIRKGVCSEGSMLSKVTNRTLAKERRSKAAKHSAARGQLAHQAYAKLAIAEVEKTMPLTIKQRDRLIRILQKQAPQKRVDQRTYYNHALARLRDKAVEALFEPDQRRRFRAALSNAKNRGQTAPQNFFIEFDIN